LEDFLSRAHERSVKLSATYNNVLILNIFF
jgi:hypothetical protein